MRKVLEKNERILINGALFWYNKRMGSIDIASLIRTLQAVAWLLTNFPEIVELDLNPVFTGPGCGWANCSG